MARPNLTVFASFAANIPGNEFNFSRIQLNRDYNAMIHVDANNLGPSYIIGLGAYTGGELFIHGESGSETMEVKNQYEDLVFNPATSFTENWSTSRTNASRLTVESRMQRVTFRVQGSA